MKQQKMANKAAKGLVGAIVIAGGTSAYGDIISVGIPADFVVAPGTAVTGPVNWDVNSDGIADFNFTYRYNNTATGSGVIWQANINSPAVATNGVISYAGPFVRYAFALSMGTNIGPGGAFFAGPSPQVTLGSRYRSGGVPSYYGGFAAGPNANGAVAPGTTAYVGFRFNAADGTHYGWIQLSVGPGSIDFVSAAYQSTPNTAIAAGAIPEPGTLGLLALGAVGILGAAVKRRRSA
ncbi:MAG: PEP-CTERM sorting domain-containing protein [Chthoniobacterales bacterium]